MAKYDIVHLNYMASGNSRVFLNVDVKMHDELSVIGDILRKEPVTAQSFEYDPLSSNIVVDADGDRPYMAVNQVRDTYEYRDRYEKFIKNYGKLRNQTYLFDKYVETQDDNVNSFLSGNVTGIMYDLRDVAVKSAYEAAESELFTHDIRKTEDIYIPQGETSATEFAAADGISYIMFDRTRYRENTITSSVRETLGSDNPGSYYTVGIDARTYTDTFLYRKPDEIAAQCDFSQSRTVRGIGCNYLAAVDNNLNCNGTYTNGNVYGEQYRLKNTYNSMYTMEMPSPSAILNCRSYCGIGVSRGNVYLKYYDAVDYDIQNTGLSTESYAIATASERPHAKLPYQKIEYFIPIQLTNSTKHKTNFFSVKLCNTPLGSGSKKYETAAFRQLKKDIVNAIREICENVAPANTQLLDVQFTQDGGR